MPAVGAGDKALDRLLGPFGAHIRPGRGFAEDHRQLFHRDIRGEVVVGGYGDGQGVRADAEFDWLAVDVGAGFNFAVLDGARGVADVGFALDAESLEAGAAANGRDGGGDAAFVCPQFRHALAERETVESGRAAGGDDAAIGVFQRVNFGQSVVHCRSRDKQQDCGEQDE